LYVKVAPVLGVAADTLEASNGRIQVKGTPTKGLAWKDACKTLGTETIGADGAWEPGFSGANTSGAQFTEATVDIETGIVRVKRILAIQDCGLVVDRLTYRYGLGMELGSPSPSTKIASSTGRQVRW
jgi:xanthine dehydrogenase YagR molybdenum-binding subunit